MQVSGLLLDLCLLLFFWLEVVLVKVGSYAFPGAAGSQIWSTTLRKIERLGYPIYPTKSTRHRFLLRFFEHFFLAALALSKKSRNNLRSRYVPERGGCGF